MERKLSFDKRDVEAEINTMREKLHKLIEDYGINNKDVLHCSEELDELISFFNKNYKKKLITTNDNHKSS